MIKTTSRLFATKTPLNCYIRPYCHSLDAAEVQRIASQHIGRLASVSIHDKGENDILSSKILPAFTTDALQKDVLILEGRVVGFHNYQITKLWHGTYGHFRQLAIDASYQKAGYGSLLFQHSLVECKEKGVNVITFEITTSSLVSYYQKFGFRVLREPGAMSPESLHISAGCMGKCIHSSGKITDALRFTYCMHREVRHLIYLFSVFCLITWGEKEN